MTIKARVTEFITVELLNGQRVADDEDLLGDGMVDSLGMMRLLAHIEDTLDLEVPPEHFTIENFQTIAAIEAYLMRLSEGRA